MVSHSRYGGMGAALPSVVLGPVDFWALARLGTCAEVISNHDGDPSRPSVPGS
jgi:hypothetical protein